MNPNFNSHANSFLSESWLPESRSLCSIHFPSQRSLQLADWPIVEDMYVVLQWVFCRIWLSLSIWIPMILQVYLALRRAQEKVQIPDCALWSARIRLFIIFDASKFVFLFCYFFVIIQLTFFYHENCSENGMSITCRRERTSMMQASVVFFVFG